MNRIAGVTLAIVLGCPGVSFAQERSIEEQWVLSDPTVADEDTVLGISADFTYYNNQFDTGYSTVRTEAKRLGASAYVGRGDYTALFSYKGGDYDYTTQGFGAGAFSSAGEIDFQQYEARLRVLFPETSLGGGTPYLLAGFVNNQADASQEATSGGTFNLSRASTLNTKTTINAVTAGGGAIWPFSESLGIRADIVAGPAFYDIEIEEDTAPQSDYSGVGVAAVGMVTGYWMIFEGANIQAGVRGEIFTTNDEFGAYGGYGPFVQVGYALRF
jgi:hypothetical protein